MSRGTKFNPEEIISKLCENEIELALRKKRLGACNQVGVTEQTY